LQTSERFANTTKPDDDTTTNYRFFCVGSRALT